MSLSSRQGGRNGGAIGNGVWYTRLGETLQTQQAGVALATGGAIGGRVIAAMRQGIINAELKPSLNDLRLAQVDEWRVNTHPLATLDRRFRRQVGHGFKGANIFRAAIGITAVIERIHP